MIHEVVIARYNENIEWTQKLDDKFKMVVYNKGKDNIQCTEKLTNIGRESHTRLYHILKTRDNPADYTTFLQWHPFDHAPHILDDIQEHQLKFYSKYYKTEEMDGRPYHPWLLTGEYFDKFFKHNLEFVGFRWSWQFTVSKERVRYRQKEFYIQLMNEIKKCKGGINWFAYILERMRGTIFDWKTPHILRLDYNKWD